MPSFGDQILRWTSERGSGSWTELSAVISHLRNARRGEFRQHHLDPVGFRPSALAGELGALGHVDIDWQLGRWSVTRPTLNVIPGLGLCAVMTGSRTTELEKRLDQAADRLDIYPFDIEQFPMPKAKFLKCASVDAVKRVAETFEAELTFNPSESLVGHMCPIDELPLVRAPEPRLEDAMKYTPGGSRDWTQASAFEDGLFRIDLSGRIQFRLRITDESEPHWYSVDRATGQLLILGRMGLNVARHAVTTRTGHGWFIISEDVSLPIGVERALTICAGVRARTADGNRYYENVHERLANRILSIILQDKTLQPTN